MAPSFVTSEGSERVSRTPSCPVTRQTPAGAPAGPAGCRQLFGHISFPQPLNLLGRGHAESLLKRGKGITPRFRLQRGVLPQAPCAQPGSPPVHRGPAGRHDHRRPLPGHPALPRHCHCQGQFTCPLPLPSQESPSLHTRPGPPLAGVSRYAGPGGSVLKGPSKGASCWLLSRCSLWTIPKAGHHVNEAGWPGGQTVEQREWVQTLAPWPQLRKAERLLHRSRLALAGRGPSELGRAQHRRGEGGHRR